MRKILVTVTIIALIISVIGTGVIVFFETQKTPLTTSVTAP